MKCHRSRVFALVILAALLFARKAAASVSILVACNSGTNATAAFSFPGIGAGLSAMDRGEAPNATVTVVQGALSGGGAAASHLNDGKGEASGDDPADSVFFADNSTQSPQPVSRLGMDLKSPVLIGRINTYSSHTGNRAPQIYSLYAAVGDEPNLIINPTSAQDGGDPTRVGYTLLGSVDTTAAYGVTGGQYAVSFQDNIKGNLGGYRYLLWLIKPPQYYYGSWNYTFYGEFDVIEAALPLPPQARYPARSRIIWGTSDTPSNALQDVIFTNAPVKMIAPWYSESSDLAALCAYTNTSFMSDRYAQGDCFEPIVWLAWNPDYAISPQFLTDIQTLARVFKGNGPYYGPSYFVLFTELETYTNYLDTNYYSALRSNYIQAVSLIHRANSNAYVSLGFGGYDWFGSHTTHFDLSFWQSAIAASDFTAVQAMTSADYASNSPGAFMAQVTNSLLQLGSYGKPVMLSYFDIWSTDTDTNDTAPFASFLTNLFTDPVMDNLVTHGLVGWDWENQHYMTGSGPMLQQAAQTVARYASPSAQFPIFVDSGNVAAVSTIGNWAPANNPPGYLGSNYLLAADSGIAGGAARFSPTLPQSGCYSVYLRNPGQPGAASNVAVSVTFAGGATQLTVNQATNAGLWVWLGNFNFNAGSGGGVSILTDGAAGSVAADAALFQFFDAASPRPASPFITSSGWQTNGAFTLQFNGSVNVNYRVWDSADLIHWEPLDYATPDSVNTFQFSDPGATQLLRRFYRVQAP